VIRWCTRHNEWEKQEKVSVMMVHVWCQLNMRGRWDIDRNRWRNGCHVTCHGWDSQLFWKIFLSWEWYYGQNLQNNNFLLRYSMFCRCPWWIQFNSPLRITSHEPVGSWERIQWLKAWQNESKLCLAFSQSSSDRG
jgi:hypothetical protein